MVRLTRYRRDEHVDRHRQYGPDRTRTDRAPWRAAGDLLERRRAPAVVAEFGSCPDWLRLVPLRDSSRAEALVLHKLDLGEREAIALAREHAGSLLLIDERRGRRYAIAAGLRVVGTAGLLVRAKRMGAIVAIWPVLDALRTSGFRLGDAVYTQALAAADEVE